ncbi:hypothetical protein GF342_03730 [Candidatus Woesearchaeota archaeon]|nr:hypothetical protein [Candidatus Woesearchaeota archaeon]
MGYMISILNNKDAKKMFELLKKQWGCKLSDLLKEFSVILTEKKKIYILRRECDELPARIINSAGLYIANVRDEQVRLSIEGSQLLGPRAIKNVVTLSDEQAYHWIRGQDLPLDASGSGFQIVRHLVGSSIDFMGCGHLKDGVLSNYVPKTRRIHSS